MAAKKGNLLVIYGTFSGTTGTALAALQDPEITLNGQAVDITSRDSNGWREYLDGAGISSLDFKGDGVVTTSTMFGSLADRVTANTISNYTIETGIGTFSGNMQPTSFDVKGGYNDAQKYNMSFESAGSMARA